MTGPDNTVSPSHKQCFLFARSLTRRRRCRSAVVVACFAMSRAARRDKLSSK